ncbi:cytochrome c [Ancylobacter rudongensis]|uniref:Cytochrome c n=2 Tax=Ancylobacter rudongensis TaxID=177413 RepID=A0A1G4RP86_9HYPH|nr:cytochrome c [Ancylobacter rudongensis]
MVRVPGEGANISMDSFELNKVAGAVLGVLTLTLGLNVFADILFSSHGPEKAGYEIAVQEELTGEAQAEPAAVPLAQLLAAASPEKGEAQSKKCAACHNFVEGAGAKVGPDLYGVVGRPVASAEGFAYSAAMKAHGGDWTFEELNGFIKSPKTHIPGTSMGFAGIAKDTDRADLIAYLNTLSHNPLPLPSPEATPAAAEPAATQPASGETGGNVPPPAGSAAPATTVPAPAPAAPEAPASEAPVAPAPEAPASEAPAAPAPAEPAPAEPAPAAPATP